MLETVDYLATELQVWDSQKRLDGDGDGVLAGRERNFGRNLPSRSLQSAATRDQQHSQQWDQPTLPALQSANLSSRLHNCWTHNRKDKKHTTQQGTSIQHCHIAWSGANYCDCTTWQLVASYFAKNKLFLFIAADYVTEMPRYVNANYTKSPPVLSAVYHQYQCVYFQFQLQQVCIDPVWLPTGQCPAHMLVLNHGTWGWSVVLTHIGWLPNPHVRFWPSWSPNSNYLYFWYLFVDRQIQKTPSSSAGQQDLRERSPCCFFQPSAWLSSNQTSACLLSLSNGISSLRTCSMWDK